MEYSIILGICVIIIFILKLAFQIKIQEIKKIKEIGEDKRLNEITNAFPTNKIVCEEILKQLGNETVETKEHEESKLTYYAVVTNSVVIANIKDTFTRIQTIAHECLHSVQNKKILWFNFIFSNLYLLYFMLISILTLCKVITNVKIVLLVLVLLSWIYYAIRSYLETDAMTKAPYVAKEYMEKSGCIPKEKLDIIMENYIKLNKIGIPMTNFQIMLLSIIKIIIYCMIVILTQAI